MVLQNLNQTTTSKKNLEKIEKVELFEHTAWKFTNKFHMEFHSVCTVHIADQKTIRHRKMKEKNEEKKDARMKLTCKIISELKPF